MNTDPSTDIDMNYPTKDDPLWKWGRDMCTNCGRLQHPDHLIDLTKDWHFTGYVCERCDFKWTMGHSTDLLEDYKTGRGDE